MKLRRILGAVVAVQLMLVAIYLEVEARRDQPSPFAVEALDEPAPTLALSRDGVPAGSPQGSHLVHFWATWCAPCVEELPALIEASEEIGVPLLAVTEEPWPTVERFFEGQVPQPVHHDPAGEADQDWEVSGLPDTFVVREGRITGRMGGPRDWTSNKARDFLRQLRENP